MAVSRVGGRGGGQPICSLFQFSVCNIYFLYIMFVRSQVAGTMVARSSCVWVIGCSNPSQVPSLLMHVGK